jgi:hypothetical protein
MRDLRALRGRGTDVTGVTVEVLSGLSAAVTFRG